MANIKPEQYLSGPDVAPQKQAINRRTSNNKIDIPGVSPENQKIIATAIQAGAILGIGGGGQPESGSTSIDYTIPLGGPVSEEVLHNYLDRAIQVSFLSTMYYHASWGDGTGPKYDTTTVNIGPAGYPTHVGYSPINDTDDWLYSTANPNFHLYEDINSQPQPLDLYNTVYEHGQILAAIVALGAKFVWDMAVFWDGIGVDLHWNPPYDFVYNAVSQSVPVPWYLLWVCKTLKHDIDYLHLSDPDIICGAFIAETVANVTGIIIPPNLYAPGASFAGYNSAAQGTTFEAGAGASGLDFMQYDVSTGHNDGHHADITKIQTQMWFYYLATMFIDAGCEAIHFGDVFTTNIRDTTGNYNLWTLYSLIRQYALTNARRGFVLITTHVFPVHRTSAGGPNPNVYFDPDLSNIASDADRQLLFDFHT